MSDELLSLRFAAKHDQISTLKLLVSHTDAPTVHHRNGFDIDRAIWEFVHLAANWSGRFGKFCHEIGWVRRSLFIVEMQVDPAVTRRARAESDVVVEETTQNP
jgi:hypothetical protein